MIKQQAIILKRILPILLCLIFQQARSQEPIFVTIGGGDLYAIDIYNCTSRFIGSTHAQFGDIAFTPDGRLWGFMDRHLYRVDTATADTFFIGISALSCVSLVALDDSTLLFEYKQDLYGLSTNDASTYFIGKIGYQATGDLIWYDNDLYMTSAQDLIRIVLNTSNTAIVSAAPVNGPGINIPGCEGIAVASFPDEDNKLIGFSGRNVIKICPIDASNTVLCTNIVPDGIPGGTSLRLAVQKPKPSSCIRPKLTGIAVTGDTCNTLKLSFHAEGKSNTTTLFWNFGDSASGLHDTVTLDSSLDAQHRFSYPGQYTVCVQPSGSTSKVCRTISVGLCCDGSIRALDTCLQGQTKFSVVSPIQPDSIHWDFGDTNSGINNVSGALNPAHTFSTLGSYTVSATVYTACRTFTTTYAIGIINCSPGPSAIHITGDSCSLLREMRISGKSLSPYFLWNFGDTASGIQDSIRMSAWNDTVFPKHLFSKPGNYNVCVTFTEPGYGVKSLCANVTAGLCCDGIIVSSDSCLQNKIFFSFVSGLASDSIRWDFGDTNSMDNQSQLLKPGHTFSSAGTYHIRAVIYLPCGVLKKTFHKTIVNCNPAPCTGDITCRDTCLATGAFFQLNSVYPVRAVSWHFDDTASGMDNTSRLLQLKHSFSSARSYQVKAIITFNCGIDTLVKTISMIDCTKDTIQDTTQHPAIKIPNVFTPGADGYNDDFDLLAEGVSHYLLRIYNRWGVLVYEQLADTDENWNGRIRNRGPECPSGTYYYLFEYTYPGQVLNSRSGIITLIR